MSGSGGVGLAGNGQVVCMQCQERKQVLKYIFPTQDGKKEFCSVPCLTAYRQDQKNRGGVSANITPSGTPNTSSPVSNGPTITKSPFSATAETPPKATLDRCGVSPSGSQSGRSSDEGPPFSWKEYLR